MFGLFLAYETRSIKVKQINDSRYVGMSIYNVVVLCLITAPVAMVIASQQDASFVFISLAVIFCCFLSMLLIFVPKVRSIYCAGYCVYSVIDYYPCLVCPKFALKISSAASSFFFLFSIFVCACFLWNSMRRLNRWLRLFGIRSIRPSPSTIQTRRAYPKRTKNATRSFCARMKICSVW